MELKYNFISILNMEQERPPSRGSSLWSEETYGRQDRPPSRASMSSNATVDGGQPSFRPTNRIDEPDSTQDRASSWYEMDVDDDFDGPADSSSWWNYEDDISNGPADSTTQ